MHVITGEYQCDESLGSIAVSIPRVPAKGKLREGARKRERERDIVKPCVEGGADSASPSMHMNNPISHTSMPAISMMNLVSLVPPSRSRGIETTRMQKNLGLCCHFSEAFVYMVQGVDPCSTAT